MKKVPLICLCLAAALAAPSPFFGSMIKFPSNRSGDIAYRDLVCTEQDQATIRYLIATISESNWLELGYRRSEMYELGAKINHVHPLKFLSTIFTNPASKQQMKAVYNDFLKWGYFMDGVESNLDRFVQMGTLWRHIPDFCEELKIPREMLQPFFDDPNVDGQKWKKLVRYLIES